MRRIDITTRQYCYKGIMVVGLMSSITLIGCGAGMGIPALIIGGVMLLGIAGAAFILCTIH
jgi:hypothetical protein